MLQQTPWLEYKEKPLLKCGDVIYYGSMQDDYVVMIQVLSYCTLDSMQLCDQVLVKLILTDENTPPLKRIIKSSEKKGLYPALDLASVWLQDALKKHRDSGSR